MENVNGPLRNWGLLLAPDAIVIQSVIDITIKIGIKIKIG